MQPIAIEQVLAAELLDVQGQRMHLRDLVGAVPVVFVFVRHFG